MHGPARAQLRGRSHHLHPSRAAQPDAAALAAALAAAALAAAAIFALYVASACAPAFAGRHAALPFGALLALAALAGTSLCAFYVAALALLLAPLGALLWARRFPVLAAELARRRAADLQHQR